MKIKIEFEPITFLVGFLCGLITLAIAIAIFP